jgi:hypothetical protein
MHSFYKLPTGAMHDYNCSLLIGLEHIYQASDSAPGSILGAGVENGLIPSRPKKRQSSSPIKSADNPVSAPS